MKEKIKKFILEEIEPEDYWSPIWIIADIILLTMGYLAKTKTIIGLAIAMMLIDAIKLNIYIKEKKIDERNEKPNKPSEKCNISKKT